MSPTGAARDERGQNLGPGKPDGEFQLVAPRLAGSSTSQPTSRAGPRRLRAEPRRDWARRRRGSRGRPARPRSLAMSTGRTAHCVPFSLSSTISSSTFTPPAPAHDHVHLLLLAVRVSVRKAITGRDSLVAQAGCLKLERLGRRTELQVRRAVEPRADVLQILLDVLERERHGRNPRERTQTSGSKRPGHLCRSRDSEHRPIRESSRL